MYLPNLVKLARQLPEATEHTLNAIDNAFGEIGEGGLFRKEDLGGSIHQKVLLPKILKFLENEEVIVPHTQKCGHCGREQKYSISECERCGNPISPEDTIYYFKVIGKIQISDIERKQKQESRQRLMLSSFRLLQARIRKKIEKSEDVSIVLMDIANSTKLGQNPQLSYLSTSLKREFYQHIREFSVEYLKRTQGHWLKSDGDSSHIYLADQNVAEEYLVRFHEGFSHSKVYETLQRINEKISTDKVFIKIQHAVSKVLDFQTPDILTLDFTGVEAFVKNNRYEKPIKEQIVSKFPDSSKYFPYYLASTTKLFGEPGIVLQFTSIAEFSDIEIHVYFPEDMARFAQ